MMSKITNETKNRPVKAGVPFHGFAPQRRAEFPQGTSHMTALREPSYDNIFTSREDFGHNFSRTKVQTPYAKETPGFGSIPFVMHNLLRSPGQSLKTNTPSFGKPRFEQYDKHYPLHKMLKPYGEDNDRPRLQVKSFSTASPASCTSSEFSEKNSGLERQQASGDKSVELLSEYQDKILGVSSFSKHPRGVSIEVDASTASETAGAFGKGAGIGAIIGGGAGILGLGIAAAVGATLGLGLVLGVLAGSLALGALLGGIIGAAVGEYRFTQTINTNVPLGGTTSPYVDPRPNDDTKPFYWTDAEHKKYGNKFKDRPSRGVPATGTTNWDATLSITHAQNKEVTILESLKYGFSISNSGVVTSRSPASTTNVGSHISTLSSEFPDWTFKKK